MLWYSAERGGTCSHKRHFDATNFAYRFLCIGSSPPLKSVRWKAAKRHAVPPIHLTSAYYSTPKKLKIISQIGCWKTFQVPLCLKFKPTEQEVWLWKTQVHSERLGNLIYSCNARYGINLDYNKDLLAEWNENSTAQPFREQNIKHYTEATVNACMCFKSEICSLKQQLTAWRWNLSLVSALQTQGLGNVQL